MGWMIRLSGSIRVQNPNAYQSGPQPILWHAMCLVYPIPQQGINMTYNGQHYLCYSWGV